LSGWRIIEAATEEPKSNAVQFGVDFIDEFAAGGGTHFRRENPPNDQSSGKVSLFRLVFWISESE
jgi:hypothetical protein